MNYFKYPIILVLMATSSCITTAQEVSTKPDIKIAVVTPHSAPLSQKISLDIVNGVQLGLGGISQIKNWQTGAININAKMDVFNDAGSRDVAKKLAHHIIDTKYLVVIGHFNSGTAIPASEIYEAAGIPNITIGATNPHFTARGYKHVFRTVTDDAVLAEMFAVYIKKNMPAADTEFFISDGTPYGDIVIKEPFKIKTQHAINVKMPILNKEVLKVAFSNRKIGGNNSLHIGSFNVNYALQIMEQLPEDSNWFIYGGDILCTKENAAFLKSKPFKLFCVSQGSDYLDTPVNPAFVALYQEKYGTKPSYEAALAYDATQLLFSAIAKAESADAGKLSIALKQQAWHNGAAGDIEFDEAGNNIKRKGFVYEAIDGELRLKEIIN